jgi:type IV secretory pathway VirB10-like protein
MSNRSDLCNARAKLRMIAIDLERIEKAMPAGSPDTRLRTGRARAMIVASATLLDAVLAETVDANLPTELAGQVTAA